MKLKDLTFKKLLTAERIEKKIASLAGQIEKDYKDKTPVFPTESSTGHSCSLPT